MTTSTHECSSAAAAGALPDGSTLAHQARRGTTWDMSDAERELRQIVDKLSPERLSRFFVKNSDAQGERYTAKPELRRLITFQRINLLEPNWSVRGPLDVLFCRNVMIYFDKPTQHKILTRFAPLMSSDGLLFAGHSESFLHAADVFHSKGKTVYELARKRD